AEFPGLTSIPYPSWISSIIFLLAGVPSLIVPLYALCRLVFVYLKKKRKSSEKTVQMS
ncbi:Sodium-dependent neutral amino acid transporter B(0)AT1, partial [Oryzias melastigma]